MNTPFHPSRRRFLQAATLTAAGAALGTFRAPPLFAADAMPASPSWVDKPMRWAQLTLVEDDPGKFDPQFWFDYFKRTKSDAVCLSGGGCVAYYPTEVPFHHRSQWLGDR
ncbi:MAG TPA: twin-arginine translocation signal domain-containing protein, partial [Verrucomicrobiae bacterium]|nr:twin-arginine translocation signal domain-containing protein [Verrucomicrobiae bacterium]